MGGLPTPGHLPGEMPVHHIKYGCHWYLSYWPCSAAEKSVYCSDGQERIAVFL